ncbi:MAG: hypothetical protein ACKERG_04575 [Candidatus Hodgkinia cicadicola]
MPHTAEAARLSRRLMVSFRGGMRLVVTFAVLFNLRLSLKLMLA